MIRLVVAVVLLLLPTALGLYVAHLGDSNIFNGEQDSMAFLLNIITLPVGGFLYFSSFVQIISLAQENQVPRQRWIKFLFGFLSVPLLAFVLFLFSKFGSHQPTTPSPYAGFSQIGYANSPDDKYPNDVFVTLTYNYAKHKLKAKKTFLCDGQYEIMIIENTASALPYFRKHGLWVYFNEQGDTTQTEQYENNKLIATKTFQQLR